MTDLLIIAAIAVVVVLGIGAALDALGAWWERMKRRPSMLATPYAG